MNIKQELIELCEIQMALWKKLKEEAELISENDDVSVVLKWNTFFKDNVEAVYKLSDTKMHIKEAEEQLVMKRKLFYEE